MRFSGWTLLTGVGVLSTLAYSAYFVWCRFLIGAALPPSINAMGVAAGCGTLVALLYDVRNMRSFSSEEVHAWNTALFFGSIIVFPYYWYLFVLRGRSPRPTTK